MPSSRLRLKRATCGLLCVYLSLSLFGCLLPPDRPGQGTPAQGYDGNFPIGQTAIVAVIEHDEDYIVRMLTGIEAVDGRDVIGTGLDFNVRPLWVRVPTGVHTVRIERRYPIGGNQVQVVKIDARFELEARHVYVASFIYHSRYNSVTEIVKDLGADPDYGIIYGNTGINARRFHADFGPKPQQNIPQETSSKPPGSVVFSGFATWDPCHPGAYFCDHETTQAKANHELVGRQVADDDAEEINRSVRAEIARKSSGKPAAASTPTPPEQVLASSAGASPTNSGGSESSTTPGSTRITGADFSRLTKVFQHFDARTPSGRTLQISLSDGSVTVINSTGGRASGAYSLDATDSQLCLSNMRPDGYAQMNGCYMATQVDTKVVRLQSVTNSYHLLMNWPVGADLKVSRGADF